MNYLRVTQSTFKMTSEYTSMSSTSSLKNYRLVVTWQPGMSPWMSNWPFSSIPVLLAFLSDRWVNSDNPNTTQTLEYTKDKYNAKIRK
jgi:hypothetical protein